jgi:hypothetical protein
MFEKEDFEKYMKDSEDYYDKREPMTERKLYQLWKDGCKCGYDKANEWHYVKDKLPPVKKEYNGRSELVLVLSKEKEMQYAQYVEKEKTWARGICEINFEPYAWKEIVLPKENENEIS